MNERDPLFDYLVATDQLDEFLGKTDEAETEELDNENVNISDED